MLDHLARVLACISVAVITGATVVMAYSIAAEAAVAYSILLLTNA